MQKKRSFFVRTLLMFKPFWGASLSLLGILFLAQIFGSLSPYIFGKSVDAVIHADAQKTIFYLAVAFLFTVTQSIIFSYIREYIEVKKLDDHIDQYLFSQSLKKMLSFSVGQHVNEHSGIRQSIINQGQNALTEYMKNLLYIIIPNVLQIGITLGILAYMEWRIAFVALTFIVLYIWIATRRNKRFFTPIDTMRKKRQHQSKLQNEFFRNSTLIIAEAKESDIVDEYNVSGNSLLDFSHHVWIKYFKSFYAEYPLIIIGQYASLGLGTYLIFTGHLSAGMFVTLTAWIGSMIFGNLIQLMKMQRRMLFQVVQINKLYDLLDIVPDIDPNLNGKILESLDGRIEFKDVSFVYPYRYARTENMEEDDDLEIDDKLEAEHAVLKTSLVIPAGAKVGFVGASGSGKSTLVNLMRRYYDPSEGEILIDGVPLKDINLYWFRQHVGNVEQKIELLDRSIRENILFAMSPEITVSEDQIAKAIKDASLEDFIAKLPEGLNTIIGENGIKVSGGERQRIGIARALIKNPKILIFDEATSALDSVNEKLIHEAINRGSKGRTTIVIAHRLSTIMDADVIFVVDDGKVVASGTHEELQKKSKDYQKLIKHQVLAS